MTAEKRIEIVRTFAWIQLLIMGAFGFVVLTMLSTAGFSAVRDAAPDLAVVAVVAMTVAILGWLALWITLPWIVLHAIKVRQEKWATAAMISLIVQVVFGGGVLSIFPIISIVLLLNKETGALIGLK